MASERQAVVTVDFGKRVKGRIKPLHGVNNSPLSLYEPPLGFREAGIPFCRLHDTGGAFGGARFVDIPNVFPDFEADPSDPASYDFAFTDALLTQLHAAGTEPFYRLGVTIENHYRIKPYHIHPPKDFRKWAEICAGVVRHYNAGWADGFHFGIRYWEIWNEAENPPMWTGTRKEFFELYRITANRLKKEFPGIKVGGYGSCGFRILTRGDCVESEFHRNCSEWMESFLKYVTAKKSRAPLDFFSWHLYSLNPEEIGVQAEFVGRKLKEYGLTETENIFDEWNYVGRGYGTMKKAEGACFTAAAFCLLQDSPVDKAMYYDAFPSRGYCGLYHFPDIATTKTWSVFFMWNQLYRLGGRFRTTVRNSRRAAPVRVEDPAYSLAKVRKLPGQLYACAAADRRGKALLLVNCGADSCRVTLELSGAKREEFSGRIVDNRHDRAPFVPAGEFVLPPFAILLLTSGMEVGDKALRGRDTSLQAGLDDRAGKKKKAKK